VSWLTEYVRPKIRTLLGRREVPDNLWQQCPSCQQMLFTRDLERNLKVCTSCGHHLRPTAPERLAYTLDDGFTRIELPRAPADPLKFKDSKKYPERLKEARDRTGLEDAILVAHGTILGKRAVVAAMAFEFMAGSIGARMQEGAISLMQMPRTTIATQMVKEAGLPFITVLTDPTTGGVTASFAMLGDLQIAEPGALIGFAGSRVIEQTVREVLPEGFQRAEYLLEHGILDMVVPRTQLRETLARILGLLAPHTVPGGTEAELVS